MYGGTAGEMARLINDSGVLGDTMTVTEKTVNDVSFDKMIEAIHVIQDEMGITGTTSKEAATTIEGSVSSMKSSWKNLMTEIAKEDGNIPKKIDELVESSEIALDMILKRVETSLNGIGKLVEKAAPIISAKLPGIIQKILPGLLKNGAILISSVSKALIKSIPGVVKDIVDAVVESFGLTSQWNELKTKLSPIVESFISIGEDIFKTASKIAGTIAETLGNIDFSKLLDGFSGILDKIEPLIETIGNVFSELAENVLAPLVTWAAENGIPAAFDLISAALSVLQSAIEYLEPIATKIWENFLQPLSNWAGDAVVTIMEKLADALNAIAGDPETVEHLTNIAIALAAIKVSESAVTGIMNMGTAIKKLASNAKGASANMSILGKAGAVVGAAIAGWEIGSWIYDKFEEEIDGVLYPIFDQIVIWWEDTVAFFTETIPDFFSDIGEWCSEAWENIKSIFSNVSEWFSGIFQSAATGIENIWNGIKGFFSGIWNGIVEVFSNVGEWFSEKFQAAVDNIKNVFSGIKDFFSGIWDSITEVFSNVGSWFSEKFQNAVDNVKSAFSGVKDFFTGVWDGIKSVFSGVSEWFKGVFEKAVEVIKVPLNSIIDGINWIIGGLNKISFEIPDWVPGVGGKGFGIDIDKVPKLARGGIVDDPTLALIGERGKEAVVPLENNLGWIDKIAEKLNNTRPTASGIIIENINVTVSETEGMNIGREIAEQIAEKLEELKLAQITARGGTGW